MIEEMNKVKALFPENVEKIIITKNDYDRLTGDLTLENIELKQEIERLNNIINEFDDFITNVDSHINLGDESEEFILVRDKWLELQELKGVDKE